MIKYRWGIIGLGSIAHAFAENFASETSELAAVASREQAKADTFAEYYQIPQAYGSYEALLADPQIDIIYIAVPNQFHFEHIVKALTAGKHVLCEKAITLNQVELAECMTMAKKNHLILQEAMTIFNMPLYPQLRKLIQENKLGQLKMIQAPFGSYKEPDPKNRFFNPDLAGGALLDIGTYAVSFARYFMTSQPTVTASQMIPFSTGVDEQSVTILRNEKDEMAAVTLTFQAKMPKVGIVAFENGYITIPEYPRADKATITFNDGSQESVIAGESNLAFYYEIENMVKTIEGAPNTSLSLTQDVIRLLDQMKKQWR